MGILGISVASFVTVPFESVVVVEPDNEDVLGIVPDVDDQPAKIDVDTSQDVIAYHENHDMTEQVKSG